MQSSESLRHEVLASYTALNTHDESHLRALFTDVDEAVMIGTCASDWYTGTGPIAALIDQFRDLPDLVVEPGEVRAYEHGDVGWFIDRPVLKAGGRPAMPARMTGVAVRVDGRWHAIQSHLSLPAPAEVWS